MQTRLKEQGAASKRFDAASLVFCRGTNSLVNKAIEMGSHNFANHAHSPLCLFVRCRPRQ
eukprot:4131367-Pleurochrysis_carterae.AAC.1